MTRICRGRCGRCEIYAGGAREIHGKCAGDAQETRGMRGGCAGDARGMRGGCAGDVGDARGCMRALVVRYISASRWVGAHERGAAQTGGHAVESGSMETPHPKPANAAPHPKPANACKLGSAHSEEWPKVEG